jgi:hypothetical protein
MDYTKRGGEKMDGQKRYCGNCGFFAVCYTMGERELEREGFGKCKMLRTVVGEKSGEGCVYWENTDRRTKRRKKGVQVSLNEIAEKVETLGLLIKEHVPELLLEEGNGGQRQEETEETKE